MLIMPYVDTVQTFKVNQSTVNCWPR